jgi:hypothetical protein
VGSTRAWGLLTYAPYLVPFRERARVFQEVVSRVRRMSQLLPELICSLTSAAFIALPLLAAGL